MLSASFRTEYVRPDSNRQIAQLLKSNEGFFTLCTLITKVARVPRPRLLHLLQSYKDDSTFFRQLPVYDSPAASKGPPAASKGRLRNATIAKEFLGNFAKGVKQYLDFGAGNLTFTYAMANVLGVGRGGVFATDVEQDFEKGWAEKRAEYGSAVRFEFLTKDGTIPFTQSFDLISAIMVLHHIEDVVPTIQMLARRLKPKGILLIKEHDCHDAQDRMLVDMEHSLYLAGNQSYEQIPKQVIWCKRRTEWDAELRKAGLTLVRWKWFYSDKETIGPTRAYLAMYQKK